MIAQFTRRLSLSSTTAPQQLIRKAKFSFLYVKMASTASSHEQGSSRQLVVDPFCFRAFEDPNYSGYLGGSISRAEFEDQLNDLFEKQGRPLVDGYAPFCKHFFVENFVGDHLKTPVVEITPENERLLRSGYEARTPEELPVLQRWFDATDVETPKAEWLDIILYSADQIVKENAAMGKERDQTEPWGIVSIKPQNVNTELPMQPITMLRNALGKEQGGSGVALKREAYNESVNFWKCHAPVRANSK